MRSLIGLTVGIGFVAFACGGDVGNDLPAGFTAGSAGTSPIAGGAGFTARGAGTAGAVMGGSPPAGAGGSTLPAGAPAAGAGGSSLVAGAPSMTTAGSAGAGGATYEPAIHNAGACTPGGGVVTLASNLSGFVTNGDVLVVVDNAYDRPIHTIGLDGTTALLAELQEPTLFGVTSDAVYLTAYDPAEASDSTATAPVIYRVPLDASGAAALPGTEAYHPVVASDGPTLYFEQVDSVFTLGPTDIMPMDAFDTQADISGIAFVQGDVYVSTLGADVGAGRILRVTKGSKAPPDVVVSGLGYARGLQSDGAALYWSDDSATAGNLVRFVPGGAAPNILAPGRSDVFAVSAGALYVLTEGQLTIVPKNGSPPTTRALDVEDPANAAFVGETLVWLQNGGQDGSPHPTPSLVAYCP